jgi:hypothetical protein
MICAFIHSSNYIVDNTNTSMLNGLQQKLVTFNVSSLKSEETIFSAELRIHKSTKSQSDIDSLEREICHLNEGLTLLLMSEINGQDQVIQQVKLDYQSLSQDQWIVFSNIDPVIIQWIHHNNHDTLNNKMIKLAFKGGCASINPADVGIMSSDSADPLLVVFQNKNESQLGFDNMQKVPTTQTFNRRKRSHTDERCKLHQYTVSAVLTDAP